MYWTYICLSCIWTVWHCATGPGPISANTDPPTHMEQGTTTTHQKLRRLKLHGQNHTKCTQFGTCRKIVFHRLCFLKTEY